MFVNFKLFFFKTEDSSYSLSSDDERNGDQPSTSGTQRKKLTRKVKEENVGSSKTKKKRSKSVRKTSKTKKRKTKTNSVKRKRPVKRRKIGTTKKTKKRKTRAKSTRTKRIKIENEDGTITEKIVKTRVYRRKKQRRRKRKVEVRYLVFIIFSITHFKKKLTHSFSFQTVSPIKRRLRVKSIRTPKTPKGRLALMLGMVAPRNPKQLIPDVKIRPNNSLRAMDLNRSRAGIPKLHIFGPKNEFQYYSSE